MKVRKELRFATHIATNARVPSSAVDVVVLDVSTTGCLIQTQSILAQVGATILLRLSDIGEVAGELVWKDKNHCGVKFFTPLAEESIDLVEITIN
jgi:hypothetical protein